MADLFHPPRRQVGDDQVRYVLEERWGDGPLLGCVGMNPSHASAERGDMTWNAWRGFAEAWGFGGQIAVNPCPWRSPSPDFVLGILADLRRDHEGNLARSAQLTMNLRSVEFEAHKPAVWLLGWGDGGGRFDKTFPVLDDLINALRCGGARNFVAFKLTQQGNPQHVLARGKARIPRDAVPRVFDPTTGRLGVAVVPLAFAKDAA